jgi:hypothetical protein
MPSNTNQSKISNYGLYFNGGSYINLGNSSLGLTANSISIWFKTTSTTSGQQLLSKYGSTAQFQFRLETNGTITLYSFQSSGGFATLQSASGYNDGNWHNVITTFNTTDGHKMYVDGNTTPVDTDTVNKSALQSSSERMLIGVRDSSTGVIDTARYFNGQIDAVSIYNYALSASQITTLYGSSSTGIGNPMALPRTPIAYYPLGTSAWNGDFLVENNAIGDYVFDNIISSRIFTHINVSNLTNVTQSVWFKTSTNAQLNKYIFFVGQYGTFVLQLNGTNTLRAGVTVNPLTQTYPSLTFNYADGKWHQYIMNYDGSHVKLYIDGVLRIKTARTGTLRDEPTYFTTIGNVQGTSANAGAIGEYSNFVAYEHTLTDGGISIGDTATGEIETLYNYGSPIRTLANIPQNSNLKAWYKLDASEIYNSSSTEWEINNAVSSYNNSLSVDNVFQSTSTNGITMGSYNDTAGLGAVSWSLWVNLQVLNSASGYSTMINGNSFSLSTNASNGGLNWSSRFVTVNGNIDNTFTLSTALQNQGWVNIIATYDGTNTKFYLNTAQQGTQGSGSGVLNTTSSLNLGYSYGTNSVDAYFSNFSIWNKALTTSDISEIYNSGVPGDLASHSSTSNLLNWWKLNNLSAGLQDSKGSSNATTTGTSGTTTVQPGSVSTLNGESSGMNQTNLVQSDLQTVAPYSKYAMNFDGTDYIETNGSVGINIGNTFTTSAWVNLTGFGGVIFGGTDYVMFIVNSGEVRIKFYGYSKIYTSLTTTLSTGKWYHFLFARTEETGELFINGVSQGPASSLGINDFQFKYIGARTTSLQLFNGKISNAAVWNTALTASQVREIYNQGLPSNLNTFSGTAPIHWWQLGEGSSYASGWTFADEIASNNATSGNLPETALVNGVGTTANGTSTGMSEGSLVGNAPYSTANAISSGMAVTAKGTDVP